MLTAPQRVKFFKLARAAYSRESPGIPFDDWRKQEMRAAKLPDSVFKVDRVWGYDNLMLHFATIAMDASAVGYFTAAAERRLRWVLKGLATDLQYLQKTGVDESYIKGIYRQAGMLPSDFDDAPAQQLWLVLQMLDTHIRRLCKRDDIPLEMLPTSWHPYGFRGQSAALFSAYVAHADSVARNDIGLPPLPTERDLSAPVAIPEKVYQT
jgi:hypothetical protein